MEISLDHGEEIKHVRLLENHLERHALSRVGIRNRVQLPSFMAIRDT